LTADPDAPHYSLTPTIYVNCTANKTITAVGIVTTPSVMPAPVPTTMPTIVPVGVRNASGPDSKPNSSDRCEPNFLKSFCHAHPPVVLSCMYNSEENINVPMG